MIPFGCTLTDTARSDITQLAQPSQRAKRKNLKTFSFLSVGFGVSEAFLRAFCGCYFGLLELFRAFGSDDLCKAHLIPELASSLRGKLTGDFPP